MIFYRIAIEYSTGSERDCGIAVQVALFRIIVLEQNLCSMNLVSGTIRRYYLVR